MFYHIKASAGKHTWKSMLVDDYIRAVRHYTRGSVCQMT